MKNIGILIIATGKYTIFVKDLYESCEKYFLKHYNKRYYVFTNGEILNHPNIIKIHQDFLGWPYNTLKRFEMFNKISEDLIKEDYLFFLNANMLLLNEVNEEIIPKQEDGFLMGVHHPGFYKTPKEHFTYERRPESLFYISPPDGKYYYAGGFNGGNSEEFLKMSQTLDSMINIDLSNRIMPIWHDESALNWYFKDRQPLVVGPEYICPEGWSMGPEIKIIQKNKHNYGGHDFLRSE